ncbi:MAG: hypothetical protein COA41_06550 [Sphingopyxis sp.]|nr:MAG: hypothetical protein COA41_06550 [Sphingopyxis sp.]
MARTIILSAVALAAASFALEWLEYEYFTKACSVEIYGVLIALGFAPLSLWVGRRLTLQNPPGPLPCATSIAHPSITFRKGEKS